MHRCNPHLDESVFQTLGPDVTNAFLLASDAIGHVRDDYEPSGFTADQARPDKRRVVRVADLPAEESRPVRKNDDG